MVCVCVCAVSLSVYETILQVLQQSMCMAKGNKIERFSRLFPA